MNKEKSFDVVVIGSAGIDTNIYLPGADIDFSIEANFTENLDYIGQAGGYASRGYTRLGKKTAFIGYVGDDFSGRYIREVFASEGIDGTGLFTDPGGTSRSINFMYQDGRRKNFYDGKSGMHLRPDMNLCREILAQARLAHFNIPNWVRYLLPMTRDLSLPVVCDIQDVIQMEDPYRQDFIHHADILFFSAVNQDDPGSMIEVFLNIKPTLVIVSGMGANGCALGTRHGIQYFEPVHLDSPVIDTNGAGDSLAVGFASSYLLDGYSLTDSIRRGQIAARHTCTLKADSTNLITADQLNSYFSFA